MKDPQRLPVFITLSIATGCFIGAYFSIAPRRVFYTLLIAALLFILLFIRAQKQFWQDPLIGIASLILCCILGIGLSTLDKPQQNPQHYSIQEHPSPTKIQLTLLQRLRPNSFQDNYIAEIHQINRRETEGKILFSIAKDSTNNRPTVGDRLFAYGKLKKIYSPLNPNQFDYKKYMSQKHVMAQLAVDQGDFIKLNPLSFSLRNRAANFRSKIKNKLKGGGFSASQIALIDALLLGQRTELPKATYTKFADAGVVHVLAVSGLHIGLLLGFLMGIFWPLTFLPKGSVIRMIVILPLLWIYAYIAGMSPSILRAVTMFSFLSLGILSKRKVITTNMLCLSALILLLFHPNFILDIGFQLSYTAVSAILVFQPKIYRLLNVNNKIGKLFWGITSVTLAAQLGVLPLSLYYFHQFPGLFFVSNLLIVPTLEIILGGGILVIGVSLISDPIPGFLVHLYGGILDSLQMAVDKIAAQDQFLFRYIHFSKTDLILFIILLITLGFSLHRKTNKWKFATLMTLVLIQINFIHEQNQLKQQRGFYIFHQSRNSIGGWLSGNQFTLFSDTLPPQLNFLEGFRAEHGIKETKFIPPSDFYALEHQNVLRITDDYSYKIPHSNKPLILLLSNSPKINLERVLSELNPQKIIADGSNYTTLVTTWETTCQRRGVDFHYTGTSGAFTLNL